MKKFLLKSIGLFLIAFSIVAVSSCDKNSDTDNLSPETTAFKSDSVAADSSQNDSNASLIYMREEEKLAHDVYVKMFELWGQPVFEHIAKSETVHTNAIKGLLDYFGIADPALPGEGEFSNPDLQNLYNQLVDAGSVSLVEALKVGATIEEVDIVDLDKAMQNTTTDTILTVYQRLRMGSTHHLKAFVLQLSRQGVDYQPQYLSQEVFDAIVKGTGNEGDMWGNHDGSCDSTAVGTLTDDEASGLLFMREEEKLAHDVYVNMYNLWGNKVFLNISKAETHHTEKVLWLINRFGLQDPASPDAGVFTNPDLQSLYNQLMSAGSESLVAALKVGATIEEVDILDLQKRMEQTTNATILKVYAMLEKGSEAHLRAFVYQLKNNGVDYQPQYLSQEAFDKIMAGNE
jgi:hypothetical protein